MFKLVVVAAGVVAVFSGNAGAQDSQSAAQTPQKKICRNLVPTGTIMAKRFCLTKKDWAEFHDRNDKHNEMVRSRTVSKPPETMN